MTSAGKVVLLIDDDRDLHQLTARALKKAGVTLVSAYDGRSGLAKLREVRPNLVLLDHMMPGQDGSTLFRTLMQSPEYEDLRDIPVIMLTAMVKESEEIESLLDLGLAAYLTKPFGPAELLSVVNNHLIFQSVRLRKERLAATVRQARDFLESLVESAPIAIMATDLEGRISYFSRGSEELLGYDTQEITDTPLQELLCKGSAHVWRDAQKALSDSDRQTHEATLRSRSGEGVEVSLTVSPLRDAEDNACGLLWIGIDLSEIRRLQQALIEQERLAAIAEAVATVNHEINNPLTPILGNVQLLLGGSKTLDPDVERRLRIIEANAWKIHDIVLKLGQITRPVRTQYFGDANMIDLDAASAPAD